MIFFYLNYYIFVIDYKSSIYRSADITNLLVSLFDTTDLIIKEIQNQMASYLLTKTDYDTEKEVI